MIFMIAPQRYNLSPKLHFDFGFKVKFPASYLHRANQIIGIFSINGDWPLRIE